MSLIGVLDYGTGNLASVERALTHLGASFRRQADLAGIDKLIIPGVGAFGAAMQHLAPLKEEIHRFAEAGQPILGICLGQQLLFETSEEMGEHEGLGLLPGRVRYFPKGTGLKVPHMGWNELEMDRPHPLTERLNSGDQVYFVHSLYTDCADPDDALAWTTYGLRFPSMVARGNVWGCQFHPEKSGDVGMNILKGFIQ